MSTQDTRFKQIRRYLVCLLLPVMMAAGQSSADDPASKTAIAGKIVSGQDGRPLPGVEVRIKGATTSFLAAPDPNESVAMAVSGPQGDFLLEGIPPGNYQIYADLPGYVRSYWGCRSESSSGSCDEIRVTPGKRIAGLELRMVPEGSISGVVRDGNKEPLKGIRLTALQAFFDDGRRQWLPVASAESGADGEYLLKPLRSGNYVVEANPSTVPRIAGAKSQRDGMDKAPRRTFYPDSDSIQTAIPIGVKAGSETGAIDFRIPLRKLTKVSGKVKWGGLPLPEKTLVLALQPAEFDLLASVNPRLARVGKDGSFSFDEVIPGEYILEPARIRVDPKAYRHVSGTMRISVPELGLDDLVFVPVPASTLRGTLHITGEDAKRSIVGVVAANNSEESTAEQPTAPSRRGPKPPPPPGMAELPPEADPRLEAKAESTAGSGPLPKAHANTPLEISLRLKAMDRIPINPPSTEVDQHGKFRLDYVPAGRYIVELQGVPSDCYVREIRYNGQDITYGGLDLSQSSEGEMQIVLVRKSARITGLAVDSSGKPVRSARVSLWRRGSNMIGGSRLAEVAIANREGRFEFLGLAPGHYAFVAWEDIEEGLARTLPFCQLFTSRGEALKIDEGESREVRLLAILASSTREAESTFVGVSPVQ